MTSKQRFSALMLSLLLSGTAPAHAGEYLSVAATGMYDLWAFLLGSQPSGEVITAPITHVDTGSHYHAWPEDAEARSLHALAHEITAQQLISTPPWLDEGLAEYFQYMEIQGQRSLVRANSEYISLLRSTGSPSLEHLLRLDVSGWEAGGEPAYQAQAWSLVYFMLQNKHGRYALQDAVRWAEGKPDDADGMIMALGRAYPGGVLKLERDWHEWLIAAPLAVAYFR